MPTPWVVVGLDNGGTSNNATVLDSTGEFLVDRLVENPSHVLDGPEVAVEALAEAMDQGLSLTGVPPTAGRAVGPATPRPANAAGGVAPKGATHLPPQAWGGLGYP